MKTRSTSKEKCPVFFVLFCNKSLNVLNNCVLTGIVEDLVAACVKLYLHAASFFLELVENNLYALAIVTNRIVYARNQENRQILGKHRKPLLIIGTFGQIDEISHGTDSKAEITMRILVIFVANGGIRGKPASLAVRPKPFVIHSSCGFVL